MPMPENIIFVRFSTNLHACCWGWLVGWVKF
jgi:hypothetical protein